MAEQWVTHKFGGSSLADASAYRAAASNLEGSTGVGRAVVVSAMAGMTDGLINLVELAGRRDPLYEELADGLREKQTALAEELMAGNHELIAQIEKDWVDIKDVLRASWVMHRVSESAVGTVAGFGEVWSARLLAAYLLTPPGSTPAMSSSCAPLGCCLPSTGTLRGHNSTTGSTPTMWTRW
jgi:aspartokinase/homoserine dehydrogenase 1